jgi:hypothetical protein
MQYKKLILIFQHPRLSLKLLDSLPNLHRMRSQSRRFHPRKPESELPRSALPEHLLPSIVTRPTLPAQTLPTPSLPIRSQSTASLHTANLRTPTPSGTQLHCYQVKMHLIMPHTRASCFVEEFTPNLPRSASLLPGVLL